MGRGQGNEHCATWVGALANEEPLEVVKSCVELRWDVVGYDALNGLHCVLWENIGTLTGGRHRTGVQKSVRA